MFVLRNCEESESDKAIEYSEELNGFYFPPSPTYFPPSPTTFPPSLEFIHNDWDDILPDADLNYEFEEFEKQNEDILDQLVAEGVYVSQYLFQYRGGALDGIPLGSVRRINGREIIDGELLTSTSGPALIFQTKLSLRLWQGHRGQWVADIIYEWNWLNIGALKTAKGAPLLAESVLRFRGGKDLFDYPFFELFVNENRAEPTTKPRTKIQMLELSPTEEQENPYEDWDFFCALELSPTEEQENPYEDLELWCSEAMGNDGVEAEATRNDGFEAVGIGRWNGCDSTPIQVRQENRKENFATGKAEMDVVQLNSGCSGKRKSIESTSRGERGNKKTTGVKIAIPLEVILQTKEMLLKDAAKHLNVSRSTLKRACREYNIYRWPPREELKLLSQYSLPNKPPTVVDQGQIPQLNDDTLLPSNQVPTTVNTNSTVTVKARCGKETIKFRLSWPWGTVELKQQVKKRLELEDGTYFIRYKDEDDELILIACDDDLQDCISSSSSKSIEILLEPWLLPDF